MFNLLKLFTYSEDISNLQSQLIELQQAYKLLVKERNVLATKILKLEKDYKEAGDYANSLQSNLRKQEEFISKLKECSDKLNNLFFEDENRRY
jgi:uncharacterized coiled-coil DUF342 family protein